MNMAVGLTAGGDKAKRRELDFYPTPPAGTYALMQFLKMRPCRIWEPACGDGAMSKVLEAEGHRVWSTDINQNCYGDGGLDFLLESTHHLSTGFDAIITNPPFAASEEFIRKALGESPLVAMLLKSQYWHAQKRLELFRSHPPAWVLPLAWRLNFLEGVPGKTAPTMECFWTVWQRGETDTRYRVLERPTPDSKGGES